jgi:preprotein translocase subunit SecG
MLTGLITFHVIVCILLSITVLVQFGKGAEAGARMGGGSSQAIFTTASKGNFFTKMTTFLAIAFMVNSIALTTIKSKDAKTSIFDDEAPVAQPLNRDSLPKAEGVEEPRAEATPVKTEEAPKTETKAPKKAKK